MKKLIAGGVLIFIGLFMLLGFFASDASPGFLVSALQLFLMVFAPIAAGGLLIRSHFLASKQIEQQSRKNILASREKEVLRLAKQKGGELTIPEIVSDTSMNTEEADEIMRELVVKRFVDMKITDQGTVLYEFYELRKDPSDRPLAHVDSWTDDRDVN